MLALFLFLQPLQGKGRSYADKPRCVDIRPCQVLLANQPRELISDMPSWSQHCPKISWLKLRTILSRVYMAAVRCSEILELAIAHKTEGAVHASIMKILLFNRMHMHASNVARCQV